MRLFLFDRNDECVLVSAADAGVRTMFYCEYDPIEEENESKLSS